MIGFRVVNKGMGEWFNSAVLNYTELHVILWVFVLFLWSESINIVYLAVLQRLTFLFYK